jgi:hypothetical protein
VSVLGSKWWDALPFGSVYHGTGAAPALDEEATTIAFFTHDGTQYAVDLWTDEIVSCGPPESDPPSL